MAVVQGSSRKWDTDSLVPETKMMDIGKLISFGNLLVRKVTWLMLSTTSTPLILPHTFEADHMSRVSHIYSQLAVTHSLTFWLPETAWLCQLVTHSSIHAKWVHIYSVTFCFPVLPSRLDLFQSCTQSQTFCQILKETKDQQDNKDKGENTFS